MRTLFSALSILLTANLHAQITSGTITYQLEIKELYFLSEPTTDDPKSQFSIEFNEHYFRTNIYSESALTNWNLEKKADHSSIICYIDDKKKSVEYGERKAPVRKEEYGYYYDDEEPDLETYHEDFYKDLLKLKIPIEDTVVVPGDETKEILGFLCKKTVLKIAGNETITAWSTSDIVGLEDLHKLSPWVKGTILSYRSEKEYGIITIDATDVSKTNNLSETDLFQVPKDYSVNMGVAYIDSHNKEQDKMEYLVGLPGFINFPSSEEALNKILSEIDKSLHFDLKEDPYPFFYIRITLHFDQKGAVSVVEFDDSEEPEGISNAYSRKKLSAAIKKNCKLKGPIKLDGKAVPTVMNIRYSYSGYSNY